MFGCYSDCGDSLVICKKRLDILHTLYEEVPFGSWRISARFHLEGVYQSPQNIGVGFTFIQMKKNSLTCIVWHYLNPYFIDFEQFFLFWTLLAVSRQLFIFVNFVHNCTYIRIFETNVHAVCTTRGTS